MVTTILSRLKERSTWAGLATLTAAVGWKLDPEQWSAIAAAAIAAISLYEVFRREK
jgi:hypothetical protein